MAYFVGRQPELAVLRARLADVRAGHPHIVQIQGPPGIGKTALVERFLVDTGPELPPVIVRASGEETEALLAYGVEQLARSAGAAGTALFGAGPAGGCGPLDDPVTVGTRVPELLDRIARGVPMVLVVDDAQWADLPSLQALIFALRRLVADQALALVVVHDDAVPGLPESLRRLITGHRGSVLRLRGLDEEDLSELADALGIDDFTPQAARRLRYGTQGNPLHARALLEEFPPGEWGEGPQPLPSPRSFRLLVQDRYAACGPDTRRLVDAAAVLGPHCPLPLATSLGEVGRPLQAVDDAVACGLLRVSEARQPWVLSFPHPLVRSAVHDALGPARRTTLHTAAAALMESEAAALRHRVAAAASEDVDLAADLSRFAEREAARQAWPSAAAHLVEASRLSTARDEREGRLLRAVDWMLLTGDAANATTFAKEISAFAGGPLRDSVLGSLAMAGGDTVAAEGLLTAAWERCRPEDDPEVAAMIALRNAIHRYGRLDAAATVEWCRRALELTASDSSARPVAQTYLAHGLGYAGRTAESFAAVEGAEGRPDDESHLWLNPRSARGLLRLVDDDLDGARADFASVAATASALGILNTAAYGFAYLARAEFTAGAWDDAVVHAERAVAINMESDVGFMESAVLGIAVMVPASRGDWAAAENLLRVMAPRAGGYERSVVALGMARARVAGARGDAPAVLAALEPVLRFPHRDAVDEPGFWMWQDLYAEALVAVGRIDEADALLAPHEQRARQRGRSSSVARLARVRGQVEAAAGRRDQAEAAFARSLAMLEQVPLPFERARSELAAGQFLRRIGQRRRAADLLAAAQRGFGALGAEPFAERCAKELAASGLNPTGRLDRDRAGLTSQELVVARLAAAGRTNREMAAELVVSVKTIEYHLRNAFGKLDISRRQLRARLAELHQE
ncbi:ATP-binding protein [Pseudonocardia sp. H11422]|uniref:ATP-binding protein n=1 Tax=Pseudonocardia sp. H11422 TaxID=2835866 RepID=UPI001BDBF1CA|nr:LuxR family transcriptional regulator [Pseudonocardia sp. H11422]